MSNEWRDGYRHHGTRLCDSCVGTGVVDGARCAVCWGEGKYEVGCGGKGRMDERYGLAECIYCGRMVPREELVRVD